MEQSAQPAGSAPGAGPDRDTMETAVRRYFAACNAVDRDLFAQCVSENVVHYLAKGMHGPVYGIDPIVERWGADVRANSSSWTVDGVYADERTRTAVCEWTSVKPGLGTVLRGAEVYRFDDAGLIDEVRIYYASRRDDTEAANELEGFPYAERGFRA
ncbi:nuclear transport factor 2 family protein [Streptomyces boncukensis]|uniref:Nuclear transport factor 2 family protein n=1 Tax=Streptomyces boncukensis TaxID=2711219 RepID=A0A6G4WXH8_9ACTN|nr:nuclear transport factor 2 family protein [Streptomyces boncukensis]NGO69562.1 nuclear transport factor 2 family protein [Streptomyces boncukensis]